MATAPIHAPQVGSGKVTDSQVAFMVECYLRDSHFSRTLEEFRSEAARLLHPLRAVPKGARSLSAVLNDYVALKEEQISATAEKARVEDLFNGLQEILSVYLAGAPKKNGAVAETGSGRLASTFSPPPQVTPPAVTMQQPQFHGSTASEAGNAFASADQHSTHKQPSTSKRKSLDNVNQENLQQGDSSVDPAKKSRRGPNPSAAGSSVNVHSPTASTGNMTVQPATPPMCITNSSKLQQQQQQALPSLTSSGSPQALSLPTAIRSSIVSPKHASDTPALPSLREDRSQSHHDPQTPPLSSIKSSLTNNCMSAPIAANAKSETRSTTVQGKHIGEQQRPKASLPHLSSSTCPYALRGHRKPGSELPNASLSDAKLNCTQKMTRKKANNSKCRLLDFSSAAEEVSKHVSPLNEVNGVGVSSSGVDGSTNDQQTCGSYVGVSSPGVEVLTINQQTSTFSPEAQVKLESEQLSDLSPPTQSSQESQISDFALPCDTFSFDELFELDLDTSLISELEDLAAFTGSNEGQPSCLKTSEMDGLPLMPELATRGILVDVGNIIHQDDATSLGPHCANSLASPSKARKPAIANEVDKENMQAAVVSSSPQLILIS